MSVQLGIDPTQASRVFKVGKVFKMQISKRCIFFQSSGKPRSTSQFFVITFRQHISAHSPRRPGSTESLDISRVFAQTGGDKKAHKALCITSCPTCQKQHYLNSESILLGKGHGTHCFNKRNTIHQRAQLSAFGSFCWDCKDATCFRFRFFSSEHSHQDKGRAVDTPRFGNKCHASSSKCLTSSNRCLTSSNEKLVVTSAVELKKATQAEPQRQQTPGTWLRAKLEATSLTVTSVRRTTDMVWNAPRTVSFVKENTWKNGVLRDRY